MSALVKANSLSKVYSGRIVLDKVSFSIDRAQITFLMGPNGAGKSTLAKILLSIQQPTSGTLETAREISCRYLPQKVALNTQVPLSARSVLELVSGSKLENGVLCQNFGIEGILNLRLSELSGGQLQKLLIVANLMAKPDLLVLDEPMDGLDIEAQIELHKIIPKIRDEFGSSILLISHDLHTIANYSDQTLCLNKSLLCYADSVESRDQVNLAIYKHRH